MPSTDSYPPLPHPHTLVPIAAYRQPRRPCGGGCGGGRGAGVAAARGRGAVLAAGVVSVAGSRRALGAEVRDVPQPGGGGGVGAGDAAPWRWEVTAAQLLALGCRCREAFHLSERMAWHLGLGPRAEDRHC
jgi:hypothetical protein